jgi:rod shape-determining protein MreC
LTISAAKTSSSKRNPSRRRHRPRKRPAPRAVQLAAAKPPWKLKLANVVMRDPANWWRTMQIDLGSRDGLRENLPVITDAGLVGRVSSVSLTHSQVVLIGDPNCRVSALVENAARDMGVLIAGGTLDTSLVELTYLASSANLKPGQSVITSGLGGVFPKGIPIGKSWIRARSNTAFTPRRG